MYNGTIVHWHRKHSPCVTNNYRYSPWFWWKTVNIWAPQPLKKQTSFPCRWTCWPARASLFPVYRARTVHKHQFSENMLKTQLAKGPWILEWIRLRTTPAFMLITKTLENHLKTAKKFVLLGQYMFLHFFQQVKDYFLPCDYLKNRNLTCILLGVMWSGNCVWK